MQSGLYKFSKVICFDSYTELDCSRRKAFLALSGAVKLELQFSFQIFSSIIMTREKGLKL